MPGQILPEVPKGRGLDAEIIFNLANELVDMGMHLHGVVLGIF